MKIILFTVLFIIEVYLSHQNGKKFGAESKALSECLHLNEHLIRTDTHISFCTVLTFLSLFISKRLCVAVVLWAIIDEATKPLLKNGRHFSLKDVGWNVVGIMTGVVAWKLASLL